MPTKLRHAAIAFAIATAALVALVAQGCTVDVPVTLELTLEPGDTIDPEYGFCKWSWYSDEPRVIWGHVNDVSVSPFGMGLPYRVGDLVPSQYGQCRIIAGDPCGASDENAITQRMGWIRVRLYE